MSKAYNRVPTGRLLFKLSGCGLSPHSLKWMNSFLANRRQRVKVGNTAWCNEIGSLASLNAPDLHASSDVREPISLHQAVCTPSWLPFHVKSLNVLGWDQHFSSCSLMTCQLILRGSRLFLQNTLRCFPVVTTSWRLAKLYVKTWILPRITSVTLGMLFHAGISEWLQITSKRTATQDDNLGTGNSSGQGTGSDPDVVCQKNSSLKVSVSLGGFGPSVAHGKQSLRGRCVQATKKNNEETCSLLDAIGRRACGRWRDWV